MKDKAKPPQSHDGPTQIFRCGYFVEAKNRQCKMTRKADEKFCSQHQTDKHGRKRIACPYGPNHTVWEDQLAFHLTKCQQKPIEQRDAWFSKDVNLADQAGEPIDKSQVDFKKWIPIVEQVYATIDETVERDVRDHAGLKQRLEEVENKKHAAQQASLIAHMGALGILDPGVAVSEFGSGRAELSRYISRSQAVDCPTDVSQLARNFLLVDRSSQRRKFDGKMRQDAEERGEQTPQVERLRIDIKDLKLGTALTHFFPSCTSTSVVSKHLCGCATDLTLACIKNSSVKVKGIAIALCCRQLCTYNTYPSEGKRFLATHDITEAGFMTLTRMTSWAVCGKGQQPKSGDREDGDKTGLTQPEREIVGLKARRILDYGRLLEVRSMGYTAARLVEYVDRDVSVENTCLLAAADDQI